MNETEACLEGLSYICWTIVWISLLIFAWNIFNSFIGAVNKPITEEEVQTYIKAQKKVQNE